MSIRAARTRPAAAPLPTREAILDAAEHLFAAHGVDGVAVRDLANELRLTPSSLYNHFPGKQALYQAVLERGLRPIVELIAAEWGRDEVSRESVAATVDRLVTHLAEHPNLAPLLQRALLEESSSVHELIGRWIGELYERGVAVVGTAAARSGWEPAQVPHLALGLFGLVFAYFVNAAPVRRVRGWGGDPFGADPLAAQRRFLEHAILRLLGPDAGAGRTSTPRNGRTTTRRRSNHG